MAFERDENELGALWNKTGAKGDYMTGTINGQPVVVFRAQKRSDKSPDWRVLKAKPRDEQPANRPQRELPPIADDESVPF